MRRLFASIVVAVVAPLPGVGLWPSVQPAAAGHLANDHTGADPEVIGTVVGVDDSDRDAENWKWVPEQVDIAAGDTVTWDMTGAKMPHSAKAEDGSWDSGYVMEGSRWSRTFDQPGEYRYHCYPHPWKKGVVRVK